MYGGNAASCQTTLTTRYEGLSTHLLQSFTLLFHAEFSSRDPQTLAVHHRARLGVRLQDLRQSLSLQQMTLGQLVLLLSTHVLYLIQFLSRQPTSTPQIKVKAFSYSIPSVGPGADPSVQAVSPQVTVSHPPGGRLPLLSTRSVTTFPATEHHRPLAGTKLYCLVTEAHRCEQLAQGCYAALPRIGFEPATY